MLMETKTFKIASALEALIINLKYKVACDKHCVTGTKEVSKRVKDIQAIVLWGEGHSGHGLILLGTIHTSSSLSSSLRADCGADFIPRGITCPEPG